MKLCFKKSYDRFEQLYVGFIKRFQYIKFIMAIEIITFGQCWLQPLEYFK